LENIHVDISNVFHSPERFTFILDLIMRMK